MSVTAQTQRNTKTDTKTLYCITLNWLGQVLTTYRHAWNKPAAWRYARRFFADAIAVSERTIDYYVADGDHMDIKEVHVNEQRINDQGVEGRHRSVAG